MFNKLWYLSQIELFDNVPSADMLVIEPVIRHTRFPKHTLVQTPDLAGGGLCFVKEGAFRLYHLNADGKQFTTGILGKGSTFGEVASFSLGTRGSYIETISDSLLCTISSEQFEAFIDTRPDMMKRIMRILSHHLNEKIAFLEKLALGTVKDKVLFLLLYLADRFGVWKNEFTRIDIPLTHQELGNMIGVTRESVSATLGELAREGIIQSGRKSLSVNCRLARELGSF